MSEIIKEREILLDYLERKNYLKTSKVREAMLTVDRRNFVRSSDRLLAYDDTPLRIGQGQTISAPHMVAMMLEELNLCDEDNLLEIFIAACRTLSSFDSGSNMRGNFF